MDNQDQIPQLRTNHNIRLVILDTKETVLCLFGEITDPEKKTVIGYKMMYPFTLSLGFTPVQEFKLTGDHIISVTYPDDGILDNYAAELAQYGITDENLFFTQEEVSGDQRELVEAGE